MDSRYWGGVVELRKRLVVRPIVKKEVRLFAYFEADVILTEAGPVSSTLPPSGFTSSKITRFLPSLTFFRYPARKSYFISPKFEPYRHCICINGWVIPRLEIGDDRGGEGDVDTEDGSIEDVEMQGE